MLERKKKLDKTQALGRTNIYVTKPKSLQVPEPAGEAKKAREKKSIRRVKAKGKEKEKDKREEKKKGG